MAGIVDHDKSLAFPRKFRLSKLESPLFRWRHTQQPVVLCYSLTLSPRPRSPRSFIWSSARSHSWSRWPTRVARLTEAINKCRVLMLKHCRRPDSSVRDSNGVSMVNTRLLQNRSTSGILFSISVFLGDYLTPRTRVFQSDKKGTATRQSFLG